MKEEIMGYKKYNQEKGEGKSWDGDETRPKMAPVLPGVIGNKYRLDQVRGLWEKLLQEDEIGRITDVSEHFKKECRHSLEFNS